MAINWPDIARVCVIGQFVSTPRSTHYVALLRVLQYRRGTLTRSIFFSDTSSLELHAYSDSNWAGDSTDRNSTISFCILIDDSLISYKRTKSIRFCLENSQFIIHDEYSLHRGVREYIVQSKY